MKQENGNVAKRVAKPANDVLADHRDCSYITPILWMTVIAVMIIGILLMCLTYLRQPVQVARPQVLQPEDVRHKETDKMLRLEDCLAGYYAENLTCYCNPPSFNTTSAFKPTQMSALFNSSILSGRLALLSSTERNQKAGPMVTCRPVSGQKMKFSLTYRPGIGQNQKVLVKQCLVTAQIPEAQF